VSLAHEATRGLECEPATQAVAEQGAGAVVVGGDGLDGGVDHRIERLQERLCEANASSGQLDADGLRHRCQLEAPWREDAAVASGVGEADESQREVDFMRVFMLSGLVLARALAALFETPALVFFSG
jgi:hypothetical protein